MSIVWVICTLCRRVRIFGQMITDFGHAHARVGVDSLSRKSFDQLNFQILKVIWSYLMFV